MLKLVQCMLAGPVTLFALHVCRARSRGLNLGLHMIVTLHCLSHVSCLRDQGETTQNDKI